jgi:hypothetical protein
MASAGTGLRGLRVFFIKFVLVEEEPHGYNSYTTLSEGLNVECFVAELGLSVTRFD